MCIIKTIPLFLQNSYTFRHILRPYQANKKCYERIYIYIIINFHSVDSDNPDRQKIFFSLSVKTQGDSYCLDTAEYEYENHIALPPTQF
jgi:hypothetical protein